jgi:hypothetical protein
VGDEPPPLPPVDVDGCRFRTVLGDARRRLAGRAVRRPASFAAAILVAIVVLGVVAPTGDGVFVPSVLEDLQARLPLGLDQLDVLQVLLLPFLVMALAELVRGGLHARRTAAATLRIGAGGRLVQDDGGEEHVDLDHLLHVDVAPNRAFIDLNERTPIGSVLVLRLSDATGAIVDVNPGMWRSEDELVEVIRRYVHEGHCAVTPEAAERYDLPVRGRHGHDASAEDGPALEGLPPRTEQERESRLRGLGIEMERGDGGAPGDAT